jgi:hypothetical protein
MKNVISALLISSMIGSQAFAFKGVDEAQMNNATQAARQVSSAEFAKLVAINAYLWIAKLEIEKSLSMSKKMGLDDPNDGFRFVIPFGVMLAKVLGAGAVTVLSDKAASFTDEDVRRYYQRYHSLTTEISELEESIAIVTPKSTYSSLITKWQQEIVDLNDQLREHMSSAGRVYANLSSETRTLKKVIRLGGGIALLTVAIDGSTTTFELSAHSNKDLQDTLNTINENIRSNRAAIDSYISK